MRVRRSDVRLLDHTAGSLTKVFEDVSVAQVDLHHWYQAKGKDIRTYLNSAAGTQVSGPVASLGRGDADTPLPADDDEDKPPSSLPPILQARAEQVIGSPIKPTPPKSLKTADRARSIAIDTTILLLSDDDKPVTKRRRTSLPDDSQPMTILGVQVRIRKGQTDH